MVCFDRLRDILLCLNQFSTFERSRLVFCSKIVILVEDMQSKNCKANMQGKNAKQIKSKKRSGPNVYPCRIPVYNMQCVEFTLVTVVYCLRRIR